MSAPWPDAAHVCAGSGEPIVDAWSHGCIRDYPGATPDEIIELVLRIAESSHPWSAYDRRMVAIRVREIMVESEGHRTGRIVSPADVLRVHESLTNAGKPAGERSVAAVLDVHESTIHRVRKDGGLIPWPES